MSASGPRKYDAITHCLHAALASGVVAQLLLSTVMHVPAGRGLGVRDWHRAAFEAHAKVGIFVAVVCALHWSWLCLPSSRPGCGQLFPWMNPDKRARIRLELRQLLGLQVPSSQGLSPLAGTVHGLGLAAVTGSALCGIINYLGYFRGIPIPPLALHCVGLAHVAFGYLIWVFVLGHASMALIHRFAGRSR